MQPVLNIDDIKRVEVGLTRVGVSVSELMRRAGRAVAHEVLELGAKNVVVFCGMGNNGGDGWVCAEALHSHGVSVRIVAPVEPKRIPGDLARRVAQSAVRSGTPMFIGPSREKVRELLADADTVVDCMLGTGFRGGVRKPFDIWVDCINASNARVVAVDVPSGLSAQTGLIDGDCVIADMTVTMIALKPGLLADAGRDACGIIVVAPLAEQTERLVVEADPVAWRTDLADYRRVSIEPSAAQDKFTRGSVLVVGGSSRFPGAPIMAAGAAARAGAGYVTLAVPASIVPIVQSHVLEIPVIGLPCDVDGVLTGEAAVKVSMLAESNTATLIGPGMRVASGPVACVSELLCGSKPLVIDADGLNCLSHLTEGNITDYPEITRRGAPLILTPHRRELGRLVGRADNPPASLEEQLECARQIIWTDGGSELVVVAKGSATGCVGADQAVLPKPGPAALATAGSGDVLAGMMASYLAQSVDKVSDLPLLAALACEVHGYAGTLAAEAYGTRGVVAGDIIDCIGLAADAIEEHAFVPESLAGPEA
ncbi:NAD(P)H-hydrate epimerase [Paratractidigestivibacter sp.]|uniref:NAD(P)H-hydrate epimerase n=1 Tax=Paratractidigestivibacter sp. TaxID=2847316 RepID=UPI002AC97894|nr:NAD(P)H-hydrate epimerase [Paratractidigestivibacter sp.]